MTPADRPSAEARTFRDANFTNRGKNTTAAPTAVAIPAQLTIAKATPVFGLLTGILQCDLKS